MRRFDLCHHIAVCVIEQNLLPALNGGQSFRRHLIRIDMVARVLMNNNIFLNARRGHGKLNVRYSVKQSGIGNPFAACAAGIRLPFSSNAGRCAFVRISSRNKPTPKGCAWFELVFFCDCLIFGNVK